MINYGFYKELNYSFGKTAKIIIPLIKKHKFSIVTQIDLKEKFAEKLGVEYGEYTILGLCNPSLAYQAITKEENIGLFLPCNMIVYEKGTKTAVAIMQPIEMMGMVENPGLAKIATQVEEDLKALFDDIN